MSMEWIRRTYNVPAKRGGRIKFTGNIGREPLIGTISGSRNGYLRVTFDDEARTRTLHPTWEVEYFPCPTSP